MVHLHLRKVVLTFITIVGNVGIQAQVRSAALYKLDVRGNLRVGDGSIGEQDIQFFC